MSKFIDYQGIKIPQHAEQRKGSYNNVSVKTAEFDYVYNNFIESYENNSSVEEKDLIDFYQTCQYLQNNLSINSETINNVYYKWFSVNKPEIPTPLEKEYIDEITKNILKRHLSNLKKFAFYTHIKFDNFEGETREYNNLFIKYNLKESLIKDFTNLINKPLELNNDYLLSKIKNPLFYLHLDKIENKKYEVLAYRIKKYVDGSNLSKKEWIIVNNYEKINHIVDTQIKYNINYTYQISTIFAVKIDSKIIIDEVSSIEYSNRLIANPPLPPSVFLAPLENETNKIKILLNGSVGSLISTPIFLNEEDTDYKDLTKTQIYFENKIKFESITPEKTFQLFKIDYEPTSISDFWDGKQNIEFSSYEDILEYNKKYYYIFRTIDAHGHVSNPTEIRTVEIINNEGTVYPIFGNYKIEDQEKKIKQGFEENSKLFKRYFSIYPSSIQMRGDPDTSIWSNATDGKTFKIRLTSISTGRKIDFNIKYVKKE